MFCPKCAKQVPDFSLDCPYCKYHIQEEAERDKINSIPNPKSVGDAVKGIGLIVGIAAIIYFLVMLSNSILYPIVGIVVSVLSIFLIIGFGELIENTFETKELLKQIRVNQENNNSGGGL